MVYDDTRCVVECPADTETVDEGFLWCAPICDEGYYVNLTDPLSECVPCESQVDNCVSCHFDTDLSTAVCDECTSGLYPTWRGDLCSPCTFDQYVEAGECRYCNEKLDNCYLCTINGPDIANEWVCDACFGSVPEILDENN